LRSAIELRNAELAILQAPQDVRNASAALTRFTGQTSLVTAVPGDTLEPITLSADSTALIGMLQQSPADLQARASLTAASAGAVAAMAPSVRRGNVSGNDAGDQSAQRFSGGNLWLMGQGGNPNSKGVSVSLSYPLFNGLQREPAVVQARVAEDNAEASL